MEFDPLDHDPKGRFPYVQVFHQFEFQNKTKKQKQNNIDSTKTNATTEFKGNLKSKSNK